MSKACCDVHLPVPLLAGLVEDQIDERLPRFTIDIGKDVTGDLDQIRLQLAFVYSL